MTNSTKTIILGKDTNSVEVSPRISRRAKRISIKLSPHNGVELVIPQYTSEKKALKFLYSKEEWVINKLAGMKKVSNISFSEGNAIPISGRHYTIIHSGNARGLTKIEGCNLVISGDKKFISRRVRDFLKELAKNKITGVVSSTSAKLGVSYSKITIRDTTSRWGSCSANNNLFFSWRLIMSPDYVLEYVAAHEVAHLLEMNHGDKFWKIVEGLMPDYKIARKWLKDNGSKLHSYG